MTVINDRVHGLLVPVGTYSLLVPSALVAEILMVGSLTALPLSPPWLVGVMNWRSCPVSVCDLSRLWSPGIVVSPRSRIVVFYPLAGRRAHEFFAVLTSAEPRPKTIDGPDALMTSEDNENPYFAVSLDIDHTPAAIPNLHALSSLLYPETVTV